MTLQRAILSAPVLTALAACVQSPVPAAMPTNATLALDGADYQVTEGLGLVLSRNDRPFGFDEGLTAKRVAVAHCASRGRALNPSALGRYQAGAWVFEGGCA